MSRSSIRNSLADVITSGLSGDLLAAISVFIFLGSLRQTFIIALTIPLCTLAAAIVMKLSGFSLNIFSLGGLAIGVSQAIEWLKSAAGITHVRLKTRRGDAIVWQYLSQSHSPSGDRRHRRIYLFRR